MWWWLSFADEHGFLGAATVKASNIIEATQRAWGLGINAGGEVVGVSYDETHALEMGSLDFVTERFWTPEECERRPDLKAVNQ